MLSPDGAYVWNGREWVPNQPQQPLRSPDGAYVWSGREWVPTAPTAPAAPVRFRKEPSAWTRPLQLAVIALMLLGVVNLLLLLPYLTDYIREAVRRSIELSLASQPSAENAEQVRAQVLAFGDQIALWTAVLTLVFAAAWLILVLIGTLRRWTWLYWLLMVVFGLSILGIPQQLLQVFGVGVSGGPGQPAFIEPVPSALLGLVVGIAELAMFIWMIVAYRKFGPWACRPVPAA
jgi:hypothetical protein